MRFSFGQFTIRMVRGGLIEANKWMKGFNKEKIHKFLMLREMVSTRSYEWVQTK